MEIRTGGPVFSLAPGLIYVRRGVWSFEEPNVDVDVEMLHVLQDFQLSANELGTKHISST